jgi:UDP-N-acetylglucosamine 2-epimerase (non-hydrolysing)
MKKLLFCLGTRPEAIKLAPLIQAAQNFGIQTCVIVSGQHKELLIPFLEFFKIKVDHHLDVLKPNQSLSDLTANILTKIQPLLQKEKPDLVVVQGDTTTTFVSALAAFYEKIPVAHIEAGLRTHERYSPFPEEMNRKLVTALADYFFAPTELSKNNLLAEGISKNVWVTGNTGIDALRLTNEIQKKSTASTPLKMPGKKLILVTCHRRENHGEPLQAICDAILKIVDAHADVEVVFPVHLNPNVLATVQAKLGNHAQIKLEKPLNYPEFAAYMAESDLLLTDSGGVQEEAPYFKKPIFVLRESTERPEGVAAGVAALVGADAEKIFSFVSRALTDANYYASFQKSVNPYGDGHASEKILTLLGFTQN